MAKPGSPAAGQGMKPRPGSSSSASLASIGPVAVGSEQWTAPELELRAAEAGKARATRRLEGPGC